MDKRIIVKRQVVKYIKSKYKVKISKEFLDELEKYMLEKLEKITSLSITNCLKEKRKTLLKRDLLSTKNQQTLN
ncbi:MAG: hypothetical protein PWP03_374 [Candidatus Woesearchaeota archaeon]|nr:hypothetical protein [Candidatus Woesearchaeota archaeon]MDN5327736.1 hypothetical protein [Candidatus Woesearchaeota archaeon]